MFYMLQLKFYICMLFMCNTACIALKLAGLNDHLHGLQIYSEQYVNFALGIHYPEARRTTNS